MHASKSILGIGIGLSLLGVAWWLTGNILRTQDFFRYDFEWFLRLTPAESKYYAIYGGLGSLGALAMAWGLAPWLTWRGPGSLGSEKNFPRVLGLLGVVGAGVTAVIAHAVYQGQVLTDDEYVYQFQSLLLLTGRAAAPAPPLGEFLTNAFVMAKDGRWFGQYPPGHPLILLPGVALGIPRLIPALLCGVNLFLTGLLLRHFVGPRWSLLGTVLLLTSPLFLLTGATLLSHSTAYLGLVLAFLGTAQIIRRDSRYAGAVAGLGLGLLFLARPWTGVTLGLFPAAMLAWAYFRRDRAVFLGPALGTVFLAGLFFLVYNWGVSGSPLVTGYQAVRGTSIVEFGFGTVVAGVHTHTLVQGLKNAVLLGTRLQFWVWGWPLGMLLAVIALTPSRERTVPETFPRRILVLGSMTMIVAGLLSYVPYWSLGVNDTGPVKTFELLLPSCVLATLGARELWIRGRGPWVLGWCLANLLFAVVLFWPFELKHLRAVTTEIRLPLALVEESVTPPALVFVENVQSPKAKSWVYGRPNPGPDLSDPILYVRDLGARNMDYIKLHPHRRPYRLFYDPATGFRVTPVAVRRSR